jgi:hypothetical protein
MACKSVKTTYPPGQSLHIVTTKKLGVRAHTAQRGECTIQQTGVTKSTTQYGIPRISQRARKGTGIKGYTECVNCEYLYGKSRLLKHITNKVCLSLPFIDTLYYFQLTTRHQCTYNVALRRIHVTILAAEKH